MEEMVFKMFSLIVRSKFLGGIIFGKILVSSVRNVCCVS